MNQTCTALLASALLANGLAAQAEATTLAALLDRSEAVAVVRVLASTQDAPTATRSVRFQTQRALLGTLPDTFALREPAMEGCGRALFGVVPGQGYLAFVAGTDGTLRLATSSGRALLALEPGLVAHVEHLVAARPGHQRVAVLARGLTDASRRVRHDAALALAFAPELRSLDEHARGSCVQALADALANAGPELPALLTVTGRLGLTTSVPLLVEACLAEERADWRELLGATLVAVDPATTAVELARRLPSDDVGRDRALALLAQTAAAEAKPALRSFLNAPARRHVVRATELLLGLGVPRQELAPAVDEDVLVEAERPAPSRLRFRSIRPERVR